MKLKPNLESAIYALVIILSLAALLLMTSSPQLFKDSKIVYQAF
jgi:hypothetical protein